MLENPLTRAEAQFGLLVYMSASLELVAVAFHVYRANWRVVADLLAEESELVCYKLVSFSENWVELLFVPVFNVVIPSYTVDGREGKPASWIRALSCLIQYIIIFH